MPFNVGTKNLYTLQDKQPAHYWAAGDDCPSYWSIIAPHGQDATNEIHNPSFERDTIGWANGQLTTSINRVNEAAFHGAYGIRVVGASAAAAYGATFAPTSNPGGLAAFEAQYDQVYYASVWLKGNTGDTVTITTGFDGIGAGLPFYYTGTPFSETMTGQWQNVVFPFSVKRTGPAVPGINGQPTQFYFENDNGSGKRFFDIDAFSVTSTFQLGYFDGDSPGVTWSGAPHASTSLASRFSSTYGTKINFSDIGLDLFSDEGHGYPIVDNLTSSFARLDGAHFQRQKFLPRVITFQGEFNTCDEQSEIHRKRKQFIDAINFRFKHICPGEILLVYQYVDDCCELGSNELEIPVVYSSGLENTRSHLYSERVTIKFDAFQTVTWSERNETGHVLPNDGTTLSFDYTGDDDTWPIIELRAGANPLNINRIVNYTTEAAIAFGVPNPGYTIPAGNYIIIDTDPRSFRVTQYPAGADVQGAIDYSRSALSLMAATPGVNGWAVETFAAGADAEFLIRYKRRFLSTDGVTFT